MRAEEGDESIDELADEAKKTQKELRESTDAGEKVQKESERHLSPPSAVPCVTSMPLL